MAPTTLDTTTAALAPRRRGAAGRRRLPLVATVVLGLSLGVLPGCTAKATARRSAVQLGLFLPSQDPTQVLALARRLHVSVQGLSGYTVGTSWSAIGAYRPPPMSLRLFLSVSMAPVGGRPAQVPEHLAVYRHLAENLVAGGQPDAIVRIGWEWSATFFPWGTQNTTPGQYVTAFRDIVTTMRAVGGQHFRFDWCANSGSVPTNGTYAQSYPGDAYVDYVGTDQYDSPRSSWAHDLNGTGGLASTVAFAKAHHKLVSVPEWGLYGADDPSFVDLMHAFITDPANRVGYASYFSDDGTVDTDITSFPAAEAAFTQSFRSP
jgi:hypothetical protein